MNLRLAEHPLIVIAGPTASGKSGLTLELARKLRAAGRESEILCADSITVYRGFDIGAAKPSKAEQQEFPHHLLDTAAPTENFTAGDFIRLALDSIAQIHSRGHAALVVGGTGFYLRALLRGMASDEQEDPARAREIRARLEQRANEEGWNALYRELLRRDPGSAPAVHENDHYRILRALQAMELYGELWSELNRAARASELRFPGTRFFCLDIDREELRGRVEERARKMLELGLIAEVRDLLASGVTANAKPMQSVGYRECVDTLSGAETEATLQARIVQSTMKLAKSQRTWFRGEQGVEWLEPPFLEHLLEALA